MLVHDEGTIFKQSGVLRLKGFLPVERASDACVAVQKVLERYGLWHDGGWHLTGQPTVPTASVLAKGNLPALQALVTPELQQVIAELLDGEPMRTMASPQVLFSLPDVTEWSVPHQQWHVDIPRLAHAGTPGVQLFTFLNEVVPGGGGTLVVVGSHRLINQGRRIPSAQVRSLLKKEPYFQSLLSSNGTDRRRFLDTPEYIGETTVQVVELHGKPGDVYLVDMRLLHAVAPNAASVPRVMMTQRFLRESLVGELLPQRNGG